MKVKQASSPSDFTSKRYHDEKMLTSTLHESDDRVKVKPKIQYDILNSLRSFRGKQND